MVFNQPLLVDPNGSGCHNCLFLFHLRITLDSLRGVYPRISRKFGSMVSKLAKAKTPIKPIFK